MANQLTLKNGSFYRDGERVPLEFGNKEQSRLMEAANKLKEEGTIPKTVTHYEIYTNADNELRYNFRVDLVKDKKKNGIPYYPKKEDDNG